MELKLEKIKKYWGKKVITKEKIDESDIKNFEKKYDVVIPIAMKKYLFCLNGMDETHYQDENGFTFWSLNRMDQLYEEKTYKYYKHLEYHSFLLCFAHYLDWCWAYAIELSTENVFMVGYEDFPVKITNSFSQFLDLYLEDKIYEPPLPNP